MAARVVYSTDPDQPEDCPRCGRVPCVCNKIDLARASRPPMSNAIASAAPAKQ